MLFVGASGNDPKNDFEAFLKNYAWLLCVIVAVIIIITLVVVFLVKNKKSPAKKIESSASIDEWLEALGGKDNVIDVFSSGSRLSVKLNNQDSINRDALTKLGVTSIVKMSDKLTLVTNLDNQKIVEKIQNSLQN